MRRRPASSLCAQASQPISHSPALPWLGVPMWNGGRPGFVTCIEEERQGTQRQDQPENPPPQRARPPRELTQPDQPASRATRNNRAAQPHPIQIGLPVTAPWKDKNGKNETPGQRKRRPRKPCPACARSSFRGTEAAGFASIQPEPCGLRPALCAPSGVNLHTQLFRTWSTSRGDLCGTEGGRTPAGGEGQSDCLEHLTKRNGPGLEENPTASTRFNSTAKVKERLLHGRRGAALCQRCCRPFWGYAGLEINAGFALCSCCSARNA